MTTPPYTPPPTPPTPPYTPPPTQAPPVAPAPAPPQKSGCLKWLLIGCSVLIVLFVAFVAVLMLVVFGAIKRSDVYKGALEKVQNDPRAVAVLGSPIEAGWWVKGSVHIDTQGGNADCTFPVKGPKQSGSVHAVATVENGHWVYQMLTLTPDSGPSIDLSGSP